MDAVLETVTRSLLFMMFVSYLFFCALHTTNDLRVRRLRETIGAEPKRDEPYFYVLAYPVLLVLLYVGPLRQSIDLADLEPLKVGAILLCVVVIVLGLARAFKDRNAKCQMPPD